MAASVKARNLLKPVVAAPRPRAAARVSTSSRDIVIAPAAAAPAPAFEAVDEVVTVEAVGGVGGAECTTTAGATEGCLILGLCLLKSSIMAC